MKTFAIIAVLAIAVLCVADARKKGRRGPGRARRTPSACRLEDANGSLVEENLGACAEDEECDKATKLYDTNMTHAFTVTFCSRKADRVLKRIGDCGAGEDCLNDTFRAEDGTELFFCADPNGSGGLALGSFGTENCTI